MIDLRCPMFQIVVKQGDIRIPGSVSRETELAPDPDRESWKRRAGTLRDQPKATRIVECIRGGWTGRHLELSAQWSCRDRFAPSNVADCSEAQRCSQTRQRMSKVTDMIPDRGSWKR
jgi:hypothetical protein